MASEIRQRAVLAPWVPLAVAALTVLAIAVGNRTGTPATLVGPGANEPAVDIPVAPDHQFLPAPGASVELSAADAISVARKVAPPGFVGANPVERVLMVRAGRGDYTPQIVIISTDAAPIMPFGDGANDLDLLPAVATYSWIFLTLAGEFIGATRQAYTSEPPVVPAQ